MCRVFFSVIKIIYLYIHSRTCLFQMHLDREIMKTEDEIQVLSTISMIEESLLCKK